MDDRDFQKLRTIVKEEVRDVVKDEVRGIVKEEVTTIVREEIAASEVRIGQFLDERVIPLIDEKADKTDIDRLERKLDNSIARAMDHGHRLDTLESLPTIAHELKRKK